MNTTNMIKVDDAPASSRCSGEGAEGSDAVCNECGRSFKSTKGLAIHRRSKHTSAYMAENVPKTRERTRWTNEDSRLLVMAEAKIVFEGNVVSRKNQRKTLSSVSRTDPGGH